MKVFDKKSISAFRADRKLVPAKKLTVGQLRIATVPQIVAPQRLGTLKNEWLRPIVISAQPVDQQVA